VLDLHSPAFTPLNDVRGQLVYCETGSSVVLTMVDGRVVAEHGVVTSVDDAQLLAEARDLFSRVHEARRPESAQTRHLEPVYREVAQRAAVVDVGMTRWIGPP
jgi:5-methylthioadenosine/S-adenosylhomocysteine deaminase